MKKSSNNRAAFIFLMVPEPLTHGKAVGVSGENKASKNNSDGPHPFLVTLAGHQQWQLTFLSCLKAAEVCFEAQDGCRQKTLIMPWLNGSLYTAMAFAHCLLTPRYLISSCQGACGSKTLQFINSSTRTPRRSDPWGTIRPPRFHMHSPLQKKKKKTRKNTGVIKDNAFQRHNESKCANKLSFMFAE